MMMASYVFLAVPSYPGQYKIPVWLAVLVVSRDLLMLTVALLLILTSSKIRFVPTWVGKVTTVTLIINVLFVLCANLWGWPREIVLVGFGAAATMVVFSGFHYVYLVAREQGTGPAQ